MIQEVIVLIVVLAAAAYLGRHFYRNYKGKSGCDSCGKH